MKKFNIKWSIIIFFSYAIISFITFLKKDLNIKDLKSLVISANIFLFFNLFIINKLSFRKIFFIDNKTLEKLSFDFNVALEEEDYLLANKLNKKLIIKRKLRKIIK